MIERLTLLTILILSAIHSKNAFAECIDGKIKYTHKNKEVISNESYCYDLDTEMLLSSKPCPQDKVCQNKDLGTIGIKMSETASETGSLGFKICEKYHGTPQIMEYWAADKWYPASRCIFSDGSFIDNATLAQKVNYLD